MLDATINSVGTPRATRPRYPCATQVLLGGSNDRGGAGKGIIVSVATNGGRGFFSGATPREWSAALGKVAGQG